MEKEERGGGDRKCKHGEKGEEGLEPATYDLSGVLAALGLLFARLLLLLIWPGVGTGFSFQERKRETEWKR